MPDKESETTGKYICGTLTYTKAKLALVFFWLMLGGLSMSTALMLPARMLPVQFKSLDTPNWQISLILATIGGVLNMTVCPYISFKSDRYRSKWGRRIPFIAVTLPFLSLALVLFAFSDKIGNMLAQYVTPLAPTTVTIIVIALVMFLFQFFTMFVGSVFWYIFNDVIPPAFFGRVIGAFNVASQTGIALFNFFVFKYANDYFSQIFIGGAVLYVVGMGVMCLMLKEGEYPPTTEETAAKKKTRLETLQMFFHETFFHRFYVMRFTLCSLLAVSGASFVFSFFYQKELGLTEGMIGRMDGLVGGVSMTSTFIVTILVAVLIDRWHPFRIYIYNIFFTLIALVLPWRFLFGTLPSNVYITVAVGSAIAGCVMGTLAGIAGMPMEMTTLPKSRFGQFCAAQALMRSTCTTAMGLIVGVVFDMLTLVTLDKSFSYRFVPIWQFVWMIPAVILAFCLYREWGRLGGYENFAPPASWEPDGREHIAQPETLPPSSKLLKLAMLLMDLLPLLLIGGSIWMSWYFTSHKQAVLGGKFMFIAMPANIFLLICWIWVRMQLSKTVKQAMAGNELKKFGIPHHGLLLLIIIKQLLLAGLCFYQLWMLRDARALPFFLTETAAAFALVAVIYVLMRMEKGIVTKVR